MRPPERLAGLAAAVMVLAMLIVGCSAPGDPSRSGGDSERNDAAQRERDPDDTGGASSTPGADRGVPRAGQCHDAKAAALRQRHDPSPPVPCSNPHTLETVGVVTSDQPITPDNVNQHAATCRERFDSYVGAAGQDVSRIALTFMVATDAQQRKGQHWLRCTAVVASDTQGSSAERRSGSLRGAVNEDVPGELRACLTERPKPASKQDYVDCNAPHVAELLDSPATVGQPSEAFPSAATLRQRARSVCTKQIAEAGLPSYAGLSWTLPRKAAWAAGDRTAGCWVTARLPGLGNGGDGRQESPEAETPNETATPKDTAPTEDTPAPDDTSESKPSSDSAEPSADTPAPATKGPGTPPPR